MRSPQLYSDGMAAFSCARTARVTLLLALAVFASPAGAWGWGAEGHRIVNRLAAEHLPAELPAFLRTPAAIAEIEYLGPEPDRWRNLAEPELNAAQAPEHFIDLELADLPGPLPLRRYDFIAALDAFAATHPEQARNLRPEKVGLQPYAATEILERLQAAFREYRNALHAGHSGAEEEAAVLFYAGWLGHYVADAANPLHTTVNYNGWVEAANPHGYTTAPGIHAEFETAFVARNIRTGDVAPLLTPTRRLGDPFAEYVSFLRASHADVEQVYQLEKSGALKGKASPESRRFVAGRLAAAASELRDMIVYAWEGNGLGVQPAPGPAAPPGSALPETPQGAARSPTALPQPAPRPASAAGP